MRLIRAAKELAPAPRGACLAVGFFDGVHLGHQQIIRQTISDACQHEAQSVVLTFDQHPNAVVAPPHTPPLIYSLPQRLRVIESLGADVLLLLHFDKGFSEQTGEQFVRGLARDLGLVRSICVGANFTFGHKRSGNVALLKQLGTELKFNVHALAAVALDEDTVSSTRIRGAIQAGDLDAASQMLGRSYSFSGKVVQGDGVGRKLGFPTANIDTTGLALPPRGVYIVHAEVHGQRYRAVLNIGLRPTLQNPQPRLQVEAHLLDFEGDLYGQEVEVILVGKVREEQRFASLAELGEQIARDIAAAKMKI